MDPELNLRIVLLNPPPGVDFGLQRGSGSNYETIQKQRSGTKDLTFEFNVRIKNNKDAVPNFLGPFVQGPSRGRFIYIDIGTYAGQSNTNWARRLKIPLTGISSSAFQKLQSDPSGVLETRIQGTGKDGGPSCGTIKPFDGWKLVFD